MGTARAAAARGRRREPTRWSTALLEAGSEAGGVRVVTGDVGEMDADALLDLSDRIKQKAAPAAVVLGARDERARSSRRELLRRGGRARRRTRPTSSRAPPPSSAAEAAGGRRWPVPAGAIPRGFAEAIAAAEAGPARRSGRIGGGGPESSAGSNPRPPWGAACPSLLFAADHRVPPAVGIAGVGSRPAVEAVVARSPL